MKFLFLLSLLSCCLFAQSEISDPCHSTRVKSLIGATGGCRAVIVPQNVEKIDGSCTGVLLNGLNCRFFYFAKNGQSAANLKCNDAKGKILVDSNMEVDISSVKHALVLKLANGDDDVMVDDGILINVTSSKVNVSFSKGVASSKSEFLYTLRSGPVALTNVSCL